MKLCTNGHTKYNGAQMDTRSTMKDGTCLHYKHPRNLLRAKKVLPISCSSISVSLTTKAEVSDVRKNKFAI